jgi:ABC-type Zn2+ transport system substrate-binding protein/surface adhesin
MINIYDEHMSLEQVKRLFAEVDQLLAREGKFGVVMHYKFDEAHPEDDDFDKEFDGNLDDDDDHHHNDKHKHEPGVAKYQKAWLAANRDRFAQDCMGMAIVSANSKFVAFYAPLANRIMSRMYRCPGAMFGDLDKGLAWVQARMPQPAH